MSYIGVSSVLWFCVGSLAAFLDFNEVSLAMIHRHKIYQLFTFIIIVRLVVKSMVITRFHLKSLSLQCSVVCCSCQIKQNLDSFICFMTHTCVTWLIHTGCGRCRVHPAWAFRPLVTRGGGETFRSDQRRYSNPVTIFIGKMRLQGRVHLSRVLL